MGIAFLDVGVYVTSLRTMKNFLLVGDIIKSVWFVAFQEEPFKLVVLAKDVQPLPVATADFLFDNDGEFYIVTHDEEGIVRLFEYDPSGRPLLSLCASGSNISHSIRRSGVAQWSVSAPPYRVPWPSRVQDNCAYCSATKG